MANTDILFSSVKIGDLTLKNRFALAPLTRSRAGDQRIPNELMAKYYQQRSSAGLMISEATVVSAQGIGYSATPGIYNDEMQAGWKLINDSLQGLNSPLFLQMWHCGRASHSDFHNGKLPVSASAIKIEGDQIHTPNGKKDYEIPRALETNEVKKVVEDFANAAKRAKLAGFAGVEIHAANGYLINQFLDAKTNKRTDEYGGTLENRFRLLKEILEEVLKVFPASRVGVRLSPNGVFNDMGSPDFRELYDFVIQKLDHYNLGYLHVMDGLAFGFHQHGEPYTLKDVRKNYKGIIMGNCGYTAEAAAVAIQEGLADLISFGRPYISNPDLPERIRQNIPLTPWDDMTYWYMGGEKGYTDYPSAT